MNDPAISPEDLEQEALIALWQASETFDRSQGCFESWAWMHVKNRIFSFLKARTRACRWSSIKEVRIDEVVAGGDLLFHDVIGNPDINFERIENRAQLVALLNELNLSELESLAVLSRWEKMPPREASLRMDISTKSLDNAWTRAKRKAMGLVQKGGL